MPEKSFPTGAISQTGGRCAECPVLSAYTEYVIQKNLDPDLPLPSRTDADLSKKDYKLLRAMVEPPAQVDIFAPEQRVLPLQSECPGPDKQFLVFGKLTCSALYDFVSENRG